MSIRDVQKIVNATEIGPDELMKCALGIKTPEIQAYCLLVNSGPITIQEASDKLNKSRSTAQRLLQNIVEKGLATREEQLIGLGGYKYIYKAVPPVLLKKSIAITLEKWYKKMLQELENLQKNIIDMSCSESERNNSTNN